MASTGCFHPKPKGRPTQGEHSLDCFHCKPKERPTQGEHPLNGFLCKPKGWALNCFHCSVNLKGDAHRLGTLSSHRKLKGWPPNDKHT